MFSLKVKQHRHDICHQGELRLSDDNLKMFLDNFKAVLNHTALQNDDKAKAALTALHEVCIPFLSYSLIQASSNNLTRTQVDIFDTKPNVYTQV